MAGRYPAHEGLQVALQDHTSQAPEVYQHNAPEVYQYHDSAPETAPQGMRPSNALGPAAQFLLTATRICKSREAISVPGAALARGKQASPLVWSAETDGTHCCGCGCARYRRRCYRRNSWSSGYQEWEQQCQQRQQHRQCHRHRRLGCRSDQCRDNGLISLIESDIDVDEHDVGIPDAIEWYTATELPSDQ